MARALFCSFCGKEKGEVFVLIAGPTVFICDECVGRCATMIAEKRAAEKPPVEPQP
jgi:ATP-dependent Clp protease ATP-binding subunit ClpX